MRPTFYIAGKYSTRDILKSFASELRARGYYVNAEWLEGSHENRDAASQSRYAYADFADIDNSDNFVMFNTEEVSSGRNVEFGYAFAKRKSCYIIGKPTSVFHHLVQCFDTFDEFLTYVRRHVGGH